MDPFLVEFKPEGDSMEIMTPVNPRQEFCLILKGTLEVKLGKESFELNVGDSFYFFSDREHVFTNIDEGKTEMLWVVNHGNP